MFNQAFFLRFLRFHFLFLLFAFVLIPNSLSAVTLYDYSYSEDFESSGDAVSYWTSNGSYTINESGRTSAEAYSGSYSYVIDITFNTATYVYFKIPQSDIACENQLNFQAAMLIEKVSGNSPRATLGRNAMFQPLNVSGVGLFNDYIYSTNDQWMPFDVDVIENSKGSTDLKAKSYAWGTTGANLGMEIDMIGIFIYGSSGDRIKIYIDDIQMEGSIPTAASYDTEIASRWANYTTILSAQVTAFDNDQTAIQAAIDGLPADLNTMEQEIADLAQDCLDKIDSNYSYTSILSRGYMTPYEYKDISIWLETAAPIPDNIYDARSGIIKRDKHLLYVIDPTSKKVQEILPAASYLPALTQNSIYLSATPGEYEPASFAVKAFDDLEDLTVKISPLMCGSSMLPASSVDIFAVKCWYQNGINSIGHTKDSNGNLIKTLVPELLLKDDSLVDVDYTNEENYLKMQPDGEASFYTWISDPADVGSTDIYMKNADYPVKDSDTLQPLDIDDNTNKQFWITVKVPTGTPAGEYSGFLTLSTPTDGQIGRYRFTVNVLPFSLEDSSIKYSLYYHGQITATSNTYYDGTISSYYKNRTQYEKEIENMLSHGVTNPALQQAAGNLTLLDEALEIRQDAGVNSTELYYFGKSTGNSTDSTTLAALESSVEDICAVTDDYGITDTFIMGLDEAKKDDLLKQREAWQAVHDGGGKVFTAGYVGSLELEYPHGKVLNLHLDEEGGSIAEDISGYGNFGTLTGFADPDNAWSLGIIDNALTFSGSETLECGNNQNLSIDDNITIEAWIYPTAYVSGYAAHPIKKYSTTSNANVVLYFYGDTAGSNDKHIRFHANAGGTWQTVSGKYEITALNTWYHILWTYSSTSGGQLYVNGVAQGSAAGSGLLATNTLNFIAGESFTGKMDEIRVFNRILRSDEITAEYQNSSNGIRQMVGDLKDLHILATVLDIDETDFAHQFTGNQIFSYGNPQVGVENPEVYRRNYGLKLWKYNFDGSMDYVYHRSFCNIWNDFDHPTYKDHNFTYPTIDGVIDTIAWEGFREACDDTRYLATLQKAVTDAPASTLKTNAQDYIDDLKDSETLETSNLSDVRKTLINHVLKLNGINSIWGFNEGSGTAPKDSSPFDGTATFSNMSASPWVEGITGASLDFDGSGYVECGNESNLNIADNITVEMWMYPTAYVTGYTARPIKKYSTTSDANFTMYFLGDTAGTNYKKIRFYASAGGTWQSVSAKYEIPKLNAWYHIVWTYSSTAGGQLYVNGVAEGSASGSGTLALSTANLRLGEGFNGRIDEFRLYSKVLSSTEIFTRYKNYGDKMRIWDFDDGLGSTLADSSPNGADGTLTNMTTSSCWVSGLNGQALSFTDGGYVDCGDDSNLNSVNYTIMGWIKPVDTGVTGRHVIERGSSSNNNGFLLQLWSNDRIYAYQAVDGNFYKVAVNAAVPHDGSYHHIAMVFSYDGEDATLKLYVDGTLSATKTESGMPDLPALTQHMKLGSGFKGIMDQFKQYSRALPATEIFDDYQNP
jgi:Concanavalin A-like lectin/glucanases superfamily